MKTTQGKQEWVSARKVGDYREGNQVSIFLRIITSGKNDRFVQRMHVRAFKDKHGYSPVYLRGENRHEFTAAVNPADGGM